MPRVYSDADAAPNVAPPVVATKKPAAKKKSATKKPAAKRAQPVVKRPAEAHSSDHQIGQDADSNMPTTGQIEHSDLVISNEAPDGPAIADKAAALAFMREPVTIIVSESTDPNAEAMPCVYVNGRPQRFQRGKEQTVKRMFVEALARAKPTAIKTVDAMDADGSRTMKVLRSTGIRYPFSVVEDKNPIGRAWLSKVLAEA